MKDFPPLSHPMKHFSEVSMQSGSAGRMEDPSQVSVQSGFAGCMEDFRMEDFGRMEDFPARSR